MLFKSLSLSFLLLASRVLADNDNCSGDKNVTAQSDLDNIKSCSKLDGSLHVDNLQASGITVLNIVGVKEVTGGIVVSNSPHLETVNFPDLETVDGTFSIHDMTRLNSLPAPKLNEVGSLELKVLPNLGELQFNNGIKKANNVEIVNTGLQSIKGIDITNIGTFNINNNKYIQSIDMPQLETASSINIAANAKKVDVNFSKLANVSSDANFNGISNVFVGNLKSTKGSLGFTDTSLNNVSLPYLTSVSQSLYFMDSTDLNSLSLPNLTSVGGSFTINNTDLVKVSGFPKLSEVGGGLTLLGNYSEVDFPKLSDVRGSLLVESKSSNFSCPFKKSDDVIKGNDWTCKGAVSSIAKSSSVSNTATSDGSSATSSASGSDSSAEHGKSASSQKSGASTVAFSAGVVGIVTLFGAALSL
ncbi:extracellular leucine-rich repeat domain, receptor L domain-like Ecm33 [Schizosaccharomyces osmophilus]|uniref:Extracellular leucine-rich repeat domain, receptor L domain-like Ecm33 n=1 Tax=Schizosaccharomyces osmophilus TaxID=2545709 RepID=A0AAE9WAZ7_9SCHI|nr:extracellular leucine-rich repeat domain, receptor L domain-like Ecm33 [Schizosaccharomyces osmophilus]WBW72643.1 extracellular leucine-rich repeat domain, receptor L domain-like Ecm33 [Schizosaccharomyces osmophilus]